MADSEFVRATWTFLAVHNRDTDEWRVAPPGLAVLASWESAEHVERGDVLCTYNTLPTQFPEHFEAIPSDVAPGASTAGRV